MANQTDRCTATAEIESFLRGKITFDARDRKISTTNARNIRIVSSVTWGSEAAMNVNQNMRSWRYLTVVYAALALSLGCQKLGVGEIVQPSSGGNTSPSSFNMAAFEANPESYLKTVDPSRCFQTAEGTGPNDVHLALTSAARPEVSAGEKTTVMVRGAANAPVTFTSFGGGSFTENNMGSVTVRADARGTAAAHFFVGAAIRGDIQIQAGSPMAVGTQTVVVRVSSTSGT